MSRENVGQSELAAQIGSLKGQLAEGHTYAIPYLSTLAYPENWPQLDTSDPMYGALAAIVSYLNVIAQASVMQVDILASPRTREVFNGDGTAH